MYNVGRRRLAARREKKLKPEGASAPSQTRPGSPSEVGFVLLHLHHEVVQVDELGAHGQAAERRLVQDLVEAVVVLYELGESALQREEAAQRLLRGRVHSGGTEYFGVNCSFSPAGRLT